MTFKIKPIKPAMSHEEKVYEYARRISHYSVLASAEKAQSKIFNCHNLDRNQGLFNERCGCFKNGLADTHEPCQPCLNSHDHYLGYRDAVNKKAAALRQLNREMKK